MPILPITEARRARRRIREWQLQALRALGLLLAVLLACAFGLAMLDQSSEPYLNKFFDALWNSANLISTLGDFSHFDRRQKVFMLGAMLFTLLVTGWAVTKLTGMLSSGEVAAHRESRRMEQILDKLTGHVVVIGYGALGALVAARLRDAGDSVVVVVKSKDMADAASALGFLVILGDAGAQDDVLQSARVDSARALVVTTDEPDRNLGITLMAHSLNPRLRIAVTGESSQRGALLHRAGATEIVIADDLIAGALVGRLVREAAGGAGAPAAKPAS